MTAKAKAYAATLVQSCIVGFSAIFVKFALRASQPLDILAHRFTIAFICACAFSVLTKQKPDIEKKDFPAVLLLSLIYPIAFFLLQQFGLVLLPASEAGIIQTLSPIFTLMIAALVLKEHTRPSQIFFIALSVSGVLFISAMKGVNAHAYNLSGTALILGSTLSTALYQVLTRKLVRRYSPLSLNVVMSGIGFVGFNAAALISHANAGTLGQYFSAFLNPLFVVSILFLGVLASFGSNFLKAYSLVSLPASTASVFANLTSIVTVVSGVLFLNETLVWYHIVGALIIAVGLWGTAKKT